MPRTTLVMTREKKKAPAPAHSIAAAARRAKLERALQYDDSVWRNLNPLKAPPKMKHKSYFEAVENADRKKKLEFEITTDREPPPGFEFIPTGHPELSQECKEQSRNNDAMFFIVSNSKDTLKLDHHMNRLGYHFRHSIVEGARNVLNQRGHHEQAAYVHEPGKPEPIPNSQREIDLEADAVLRDLFPRIPHTDRQQIIDHAFKKDGKFNGEIKVGMAKDITLARRVQLAALAHIRHTHTRYDDLLKESDWANARKAVEKPCLDIIVKWRGDEETGRDQLDEILREVIEISDTETDSEDEKSSPDNTRIQVPRTMPAAFIPSRAVSRLSRPLNNPSSVSRQTSSPVLASPRTPSGVRKLAKADRRTARKTQQRFKRYAAAAEALANSSNQNSHPESPSTPGFVATPVEVRRQGSAHPVNTYRTSPGATVQETYVTRIGNEHVGSQRIPISQSSGLSQDRTVIMSRLASDARGHGGTEQFIRVPDDQRPKVGPYSANYSQAPAPPLSPIRMGLQDMLLPSIEPRSPDVVRASLDGTQKVSSEAQRLTEVPRRVISHSIVEPAMPHPRPRSPGAMAIDNEDAAKRRRVITYFPEDYQASSNSFYMRVAPRSQHDALRYSRFEYPVDRRPVAAGATERVFYQDIPRGPLAQEVRVIQSEDGHGRSSGHPAPVTRGELPLMGATPPSHGIYQTNMRMPAGPEYEAPLRSRANPVIIDGGDRYKPRRLVEVRGSPAHDIHRTASPRGGAIHSPRVQGNPRTKGSPKVVYLDDCTSRIGSNPGSRHHHIVPQTQPGLPAFEGPRRPLSPGVSLHPVHQPRALERPLRYAVPYDREGSRFNEPERNASAWPGTASYPVMTEFADDMYRFTGVQHHPSVSDGSHMQPQQARSDTAYQGLRPEVTRPAAVGYDRGAQQPFPVHPAPSSYAEIRGPSPHRRIPDHRDMIFVE
ncbi:hypothetical protein RRF57_006985 [Xylaria bambusicola]|uniref:DUF2293 domain-containing protein n=1 Tax=Xylaria bambusicola TaxID=326684 RepID=A0AAN7UT24_9PEZI